MKIYKRLFGAVYDRFMRSLEASHLNERRARLLSGLSGKVLEVGVGTGANFQHYSEDIELIGIEPSPYMIPRAKKKKEVLLFPSRITLLEIGCGYPEMEKLIAKNSLDAVVCTLVLCTIPDPSKALENFNRWLKPGGKLVILEHIRSHNSARGKLQDMLNPVWKRVADGCNLNRPTDRLLADSGFQLIREERFKIGIPFYEAEYIRPGTDQ
jgi:ubiquinone/menaquinone biosynthesis C-methylase UbiE